MDEDQTDPQTLGIRCPGCRLRFSVAPGLMNRIVECGGCETQFRITEEVVMQSKKVYPGEKKETEINQFRRIPMDSDGTSKDMRSDPYVEPNHTKPIGPASPQHFIAGVSGVSIMLFGALLLFVSSKPDSPFGGMAHEKKFIVSGFTSLLGLVFLWYANPRARIKAGIFGLLLAAGVFAIPIYIKEDPLQTGKNPRFSDKSGRELSGDVVADPIRTLRDRFVTQPLENEQARLKSSKINKNAYGIYLAGILDRNKLTARDYLVLETLASQSSHPYPRNDKNHLLVLTETEMTFDQVAKVAGTLGKVTETHPEINIMVVEVDNGLFVAGSTEKLNDPSHPSFYELNRRELESIDPERIKEAVERLADSDATLLRSDISGVLIKLLQKPGITFHGSIARALLKWSEDPGSAAEAGLRTLESYSLREISPPEHLVRLVADHKDPQAIPIMISIWEKNTVIWDKELVKFGPSIEALVLERINSKQAPLRRAAIKMLGEIGTASSLPPLRKALGDQDPEVNLLAKRAIQQIEER
jgi:hypothetical protein